MRISQKLEYACRALAQLAKRHDGRTLTRLDDLAQREDISRSFLLQILNDLRRAGLVASARGAAGGYLLGRTPDTITLRDIIEAAEPGMLQLSVAPDGESGPAIQAAWKRAAEEWRLGLEKVTLETITSAQSPPMFFI